LTVIGETNSGKSTLVGEGLLPLRRFVVVIRTKMDPNRRPVKYPVQLVTKTWKSLENLRFERLELRPKYEDQAREIFYAYKLIYKHGGWTVYNDEEWYLEEELGLTRQINLLLTQGSGKGISMVMSAQRPSRISRFCLSQSTHVLCTSVEGRDVKVLADATTPRIAPVVTTLRKYEWAWFNRDTRDIAVVKLNLKTGQLESRSIPRNVRLMEEESA
jgi:hypothetical protein